MKPKENSSRSVPIMDAAAIGRALRRIAHELIERNPFAKLRRRGRTQRRRPMRDEEFQTLLRGSDPTFRRFLIFLDSADGWGYRRAYVPSATPKRVLRSEAVPQKIKRFVRCAADSRLGLIDGEAKSLEHAPCPGQGPRSVTLTQNHEVVGIVHNAAAEFSVTAELLPRFQKPTHVDVRQ